MESELAGAAANGINRLWEYGGIVTLLVLMDLALLFLAGYLFKRNTALSDKVLETLSQNTVALTTLTEVIRANSK